MKSLLMLLADKDLFDIFSPIVNYGVSLSKRNLDWYISNDIEDQDVLYAYENLVALDLYQNWDIVDAQYCVPAYLELEHVDINNLGINNDYLEQMITLDTFVADYLGRFKIDTDNIELDNRPISI